jgi:endonuclease-3
LSAQTTDKKVNEVTEDLFKEYSDLEAFLTISNEELEARIKQIGLYRNKSKNLILMFRQLKEKFHGEVPQTMEEIMSLAGAGRKTANVVLSNAFNVPSIAVDTHVFRVSNRLDLANSENVLEVEMQLQKELPKKEWTLMHHLLIFHGRRCCIARNPKCGECPLSQLCKYENKTKK